MNEIRTLGDTLLPLLNPEAVARLNSGIEIPDTFPLELRHLYSWRNGEKWEDMFNPIFNFRLMPFEECLKETAQLKRRYPKSDIIQKGFAIGDHAYGNGSIIAIRLDSGGVELGNLIAEDGIIYCTHDGVVQLMRTTLAVWTEKGDFVEISRRFSSNVNREIEICGD